MYKAQWPMKRDALSPYSGLKPDVTTLVHDAGGVKIVVRGPALTAIALFSEGFVVNKSKDGEQSARELT